MPRSFAAVQSRALRGKRTSALKRLSTTTRKAEDGQAVVELALALPVLLIVVLGIVDFGRAVNYWNDETHLANLAARYAAVGTLPTSGTCSGKSTLTAYVECEAEIDSPELANGSQGSTGTKGKIGVCVSIPSEPTVGSPVTVKVSSTYRWLPLPKVLGGSSSLGETKLVGSATMRLEQVPPAGFATTTGTC
jgi:Flp pilus assembly protein TadG